MYYHFAKLYLDSYVLRGLPETGAVIPDHFLETASAAVAAAVSIINLLLEDRELQLALSRLPHYFHGMIAFACMFLLKVALRHREQLFVDISRFRVLIAGLAQRLKVTKVGKEHLIHRMADGLEKMATMLSDKPRQRRPVKEEVKMAPPATFSRNGNPAALSPQTGHTQNFTDMDRLDTSAFDFADTALGLGMPFFDFEGTTLGFGDSIYPFTA